MKIFKKDTRYDSLEYIDIDNEDDFFEIINPINSENTIVQFYKKCELVSTYEYFSSLEGKLSLASFISDLLPKIYGEECKLDEQPYTEENL